METVHPTMSVVVFVVEFGVRTAKATTLIRIRIREPARSGLRICL